MNVAFQNAQWDNDLKAILVDCAMIGPGAVSMVQLTKLSTMNMMKVCLNRYDALCAIALELQTTRQKLQQLEIEVQKKEMMSAALSAQAAREKAQRKAAKQAKLAAKKLAKANSSTSLGGSARKADKAAAKAAKLAAKKRGNAAEAEDEDDDEDNDDDDSDSGDNPEDSRHAAWKTDEDEVPTTLPFPISGLLVDNSPVTFVDAIRSKQFYDWCVASVNNENLEFYLSVEIYRTLPPAARPVKAAEMLRHFVREGATAQINIDHSVRAALEASLPPPIVALVEHLAAEAAARARAEREELSVNDFLSEGPPDSARKSSEPVPINDSSVQYEVDLDDAQQKTMATLFDDAQAKVFELMERDAWVRFKVDREKLAAKNASKMSSKEAKAAKLASEKAAKDSLRAAKVAKLAKAKRNSNGGDDDTAEDDATGTTEDASSSSLASSSASRRAIG